MPILHKLYPNVKPLSFLSGSDVDIYSQILMMQHAISLSHKSRLASRYSHLNVPHDSYSIFCLPGWNDSDVDTRRNKQRSPCRMPFNHSMRQEEKIRSNPNLLRSIQDNPFSPQILIIIIVKIELILYTEWNQTIDLWGEHVHLKTSSRICVCVDSIA